MSAKPRVTLIDNYDSLTWNLVHYLGELWAEGGPRSSGFNLVCEIAFNSRRRVQARPNVPPLDAIKRVTASVW